ncbi:MAG TPA: hypothetical protein VGB37_04195 [Candidatus Lokiarchaeia archaeon]
MELKRKCELILDKSIFLSGEFIQGSVYLRLKKPIRARSLKIIFTGTKKVIIPSSPGSEHLTFIFYKSEIVLGNEKEYYDESYPIKLEIPLDILEKAKNFGKGEDVGVGITAFRTKMAQKELSMFKSSYPSTDIWCVEASLDIPRRLNLCDKQEIKILEKQI